MTTGQKQVATWLGILLAFIVQIAAVSATVAWQIGGLSARMVNVETNLLQIQTLLLRRP